ncbi:hypothetical protein [Nitratireductor basaltis]|uniref:ATPase involved in DNA repair n=1 Tax=Nitratireductor basaltis TaxID=472175 RepID=A0A084UDJ0_9HYPH|nr:hypothetical protein [Nitratireductor basaltis]KFB11026.1 ATPase involved in DNA repair [Nitratireductor basaltis]
MPFLEERVTPQNLANIAAPERVEQADPSLGDTLGAAFRTQNTIGSFMASRGMADPYEIEEGFNAIDYVKDDPDFAPYVEEFAGIFNKRAAEAKKLQIKQEQQDRRTLDAAGASGIIAEMAAGVFDLPTLLIPGSVVTVGARTTGSLALGVAGAAALDAGVSEAALQATQATRTAGETALNIGGSVVLGGALGALAGRYLLPAEQVALSRKVEAQEQGFEEFDQAFINTGAASAGAAARDKGAVTLKDESLIKRLPGINRQDPLIRLQLSPLESGRQTVRGLAETPLEYAENARGVATEKGGSVETRVKMWNAPMAKAVREIDTFYARYFHGTPEPSSWQRRLSPALSELDRRRGGQKLTYKEFKEEVGRAAYSGEAHEIPEVAQAAKVYREIDEQLKKAAIEARLFPVDIAVAGDISHRFRVYNREMIIARRGDFTQRLVDYFKSKQEAAGFRAEELRVGSKIIQADKVRSRFEQAFSRLDSLEQRLEGRSAVRQRKQADIEANRQTRFDVMRERAPDPVVKALRGADETATMIDVVKDARKAERSANRKQSYAERYPVLGTIRSKGGVRVGSKLDSELRSMGVTPKTHPGLFKKNGGLGDIDNFVKSEDPIFDNLPDDGAGYVDSNALHNAIREELAGNPLKTAEQVAAEEINENLSEVAEQWLESVGLGSNATVKEVRDYIRRILGAEKDLDGLDARISRLESELEDFDKATDALRNERDISASEAKVIADELNELEESLAEVGDLANASPRISQMVDLARTKRDLFKAKLEQRKLRNRVEAIERLATDGKATDEMLAEMAAKRVDLERLAENIGKLSSKADTLEKTAPKAADLEKAEEFADLSEDEIMSMVDEVVDTILGNAEGRIPYDIVAGPRGALKDRVLKIESAKIHEFLENDIETVLRMQMRTMAPDIELAKKFGSVDLKEEIRKVNDEANAKIRNAKTEKERKALEKERKAAIRDIEGIRDRIRGTYAMPSDPSSLVVRANRVARNLNYVRLLGGMTISALPDMAKVVFTHGLTSTFKDGFLPLIRNFKAVRLAADEVKTAGTALDMVLDTRTMAIADIMDEFGRHSKFERGLSALSSKFGLVSLMAPWNAAMKQFAGMVTMTNVLRASEQLAKGSAPQDVVRKLAASGIDADMAGRIAFEFKKHGDRQGNVWLAQTGDWTDREAAEAFRAAIVRDVDRIIVTPGQDKPLWMSTELGKTVGQFKSFLVSSTQRTLLAGLQQRDAAVLNGTIAMLGLGAMAHALKEITAGRELPDEPQVWAVNALDRSGLTGWLMEVNAISEKATRGRVGFSALTGEQVTRYASRNVYGAFLGPSADAVADIFQVSGSIFAGDTTKSDLRKARQLLPAQNLFYIREMLNAVEEGAGEALNLPDTRRN